MVSEILLEQLKWFTRKLIEKRVREIDGYHAPIDFDLSIITANTNPTFDAHQTPEQHAIRMLREIRGTLVRGNDIPPTELTWETNDGHVEIRGYTTALLRKYFVEYLGGPRSLFGEGRGENNSTVLTYCEKNTATPAGGNELAILRRLLKKWGGVVSF